MLLIGTMELPAQTGPRPDTRFKPGAEWAGNALGRPIGARSKLQEAFLGDLYASWQKNGVRALEELRQKDVVGYCKIIASLMPREDKLEVLQKRIFEEWSLDQKRALLEAIDEADRFRNAKTVEGVAEAAKGYIP
jgi:hypothetical protein